jgi:hypothetical protein
MAIIYNWVVSAMDEYPTTPDDLTDVVFNVHWRRNATDIVGDITYFADVYGSLSVPAPSPEDFTPYPDLTFEQVCGWLEAGLDTAAIDAGLAVQIENLINPPVVSLPLPWVTPEPTPIPPTETVITEEDEPEA